jgi:uncharacterized protein DUF6624
MQRRWQAVVRVCACLAWLGPLGAHADLRGQCPGAAAWQDSHSDVSPDAMAERDKHRVISNPGLLSELQRRVDRDQEARRSWLRSPSYKELANRVDAIDSENVAWLRNLIDGGGFPAASDVGEVGVHLAWILLQHADQAPDLQRRLLPILAKRYEERELSPTDLARYTDRVLLAMKKPQRYGTQFDWQSRTFKLPDHRTVAEINAHRRELGLMSLEDYACMMKQGISVIRSDTR